MEALLESVEERAYELLLASQNATWVLQQQHQPSSEGEDCANQDEEPLSKPQIIRPSQFDDVNDIEDPLDVAIREKRQEIWEKIWTRLARYCAPFRSRYYNERVAVIWASVCRAVYTDPALMLLAQNYRYVTSLLSDATLDLATVERLWNAIKNLYVYDVRAAIDDVFHPIRDKADYVLVLGIRVHKELTDAAPPVHAWGHMTAFYACYSCVRKVCKSVSHSFLATIRNILIFSQMDEVIDFTRYAILSNENLAQSAIRYQWKYNATRELGLCGFIPNVIEDVGPRYQTEKCNCPTKLCDRPHWTEIKNNNAICVGLSLSDPNANLFVNACLRDPDLMVLCRKGPNGLKIRSKPLCGSRFRRATSRAGLKNAEWDHKHDTFFKDTVLEEACPLLSAGKRVLDCFQVAIVDGGEGGVAEFLDKLLAIWRQVHDVEDFKGIISAVGGPLLDTGEFEADEIRRNGQSPLIPNLESDLLVSYKRLWGRGPREGRLVDDEANTWFHVLQKS